MWAKMINWEEIGHLIQLYDTLHEIYAILDREESVKYRDLIQEWSDRLYNKIREIYRQYEIVVSKEELELGE